MTTYLDSPTFPGRRTEFEIVPIIGADSSERVIKYEEGLQTSKPRYTEQAYFTMNAQSSVTFPVVDSSGYKVFVNYISETDDDKIDTGITISDNSQEGGSFAFDVLNKTELGVVKQKSYTVEVGSSGTELTVAFDANETTKIDADTVFVEPRSVRIVSVSGCPIPYETVVSTKKYVSQYMTGGK